MAWKFIAATLILSFLGWILSGRKEEKHRNQKWNSVQKKLFTKDHYKKNEEDRRRRRQRKEKDEAFRRRVRESGRNL